jgi:putative transposase
MIERCRDAFPVRLMCRCLKVSASGYYDWRERPLSARARDNERLAREIVVLHAESDGVLGSPRIWQDLRYRGERCGPSGGAAYAGAWLAGHSKWVTDITYSERRKPGCTCAWCSICTRSW